MKTFRAEKRNKHEGVLAARQAPMQFEKMAGILSFR